MDVAQRLNAFPEYVFSRLAKITKAVEAKSDRKVLNLGVGSPDIPPSEKYISKVSQYFKEPSMHLYPGYGGIPEFTEAIKFWHKTRFNTDLMSEMIFPVNGAKDAIVHLTMALLDEGDQVLMPDPGYPGFTGAALLIGAKPVYYNLLPENNFKPNITELQGLLTTRTKCLWLNFPSNPTGQVLTKAEIAEYVAFSKKNNIWLIYDNAYSEITFGDFIAPSILEIPGALDVAVEVHSFSKSFSFAGYRMGWVAGNTRVIDALAKVKSQVDSGMALPLQKLGAYALTNVDKDWLASMRKSYSNRQSIIGDYLHKLGLNFALPKGSLYIWAKIPTDQKNSEKFSMKILNEKQILLTPGTAFGKNGSDYIRASICSNIDEIDKYF